MFMPTTLSFTRIPGKEGLVYTVFSANSGSSETVVVQNPLVFYAALACALDADGVNHNTLFSYASLEEIMPKDESLRWIP